MPILATIEQASSQIVGSFSQLQQQIRKREWLISLPFWLLPGAVMVLAVYGAISWNLIISFTDFQGLQLPSYEVSGFDFQMYERLVSDPAFWTAFRNTIVFMLVFTIICLLVGLSLAILIDQNIRFENTFRTIYLLPFSLSFVVTAKFWIWMYNSDFGVINTLFRTLHLDFLAITWLDPQFRLGSIIIALIWQFSGYSMIVYLAGLRQIPTEHYEAAMTDGASRLSTYREVVIPQLGAATMSAAVVLMVFSLKAFDFLYAMFRMNPGPSADILSTMMYRTAFGAARWAYGAAIAIVLFVMALFVISPYFYAQYRRGEL